MTDGIAMGHAGMKASLVSREVIADSVELTMRGHCYDALVGIGGCDKTLPVASSMAYVSEAIGLALPGTNQPRLQQPPTGDVGDRHRELVLTHIGRDHNRQRRHWDSMLYWHETHLRGCRKTTALTRRTFS